MGMPWPCRVLAPRSCHRLDGRVVAVCRAQARECRGLGRDTAAMSEALLLVTIHSVYCDPLPHALLWSQYTAVYCDTKAQQLDPLMSRYNYLYRDLYSLPDCTSRLQYNLVSCNTVPQPTTHPRLLSCHDTTIVS